MPHLTTTLSDAPARRPTIQYVNRQMPCGSHLYPSRPVCSRPSAQPKLPRFSADDDNSTPQTSLLTSAKNEKPIHETERQLGVDLLSRMGTGDEAALTAFYHRYSPVLYGMALKMLNDEHESEDVLQEVFLQIWRKAARYNPKLSSPFTWAVMILRNQTIDRIRSRQRIEKTATRALESVAHLADFDDRSADEPVLREQRLIVRTALCRLNEEQRQALELAFFSGLTHEAIATQLAIPLGTIKTRIRRALIQLREFVTDTR